MMKLFVISSLVAVCCYAASFDDSLMMSKYTQFKVDFNKKYSSEEDNRRFAIFIDTLKMVMEHNKRYEAGDETYSMEINKFADMTDKEATNGCLFNSSETRDGGMDIHDVQDIEDLPKEVDWRQKGAVTPVKDQKRCGSCYAFSANGALEGAHQIKHGQLVAMSEQNLVDCSQEYGNHGCRGGYMDSCFEYVKNVGINTQESYPYEGKQKECRFNSTLVPTTLKEYKRIKRNNEAALQHAIATVGPVAVSIHANRKFRFYNGGIFNARCCRLMLNHGVLAVGYGTENGTDFWIVKNSWGEKWGDGGYIKMARNKNICGIAKDASYPIVN